MVIAGMLLTASAPASYGQESGKEQAALATALRGKHVALSSGIKAAAAKGKPISAKYEYEDGKLQLSVYTEKGGQFSEVVVDHPEVIRGKKVLCVDDGPTLTHGEMAYGAGKVAAERYEAKELLDPRPYAVGTLKATYAKYTHIGKLLPAMGYFPQQIEDLQASIAACPVEGVIIATPMDLRKVVKISQPCCVAKYNLVDRSGPVLSDEIKALVKRVF
jgi:hypothetical protein